MSGKDLDDIMTFEKNQFWTISSLKDFLRRRNLSGIGNKEVLVARRFVHCLCASGFHNSVGKLNSLNGGSLMHRSVP